MPDYQAKKNNIYEKLRNKCCVKRDFVVQILWRNANKF